MSDSTLARADAPADAASKPASAPVVAKPADAAHKPASARAAAPTDASVAASATPVAPVNGPAAAPDVDMLLRSATDLARDELEQVNAVIRRHLESDIALIRTLGAYIVQSGGKRLRPLILLLSAKAGAAGAAGDRNRRGESDNNRAAGNRNRRGESDNNHGDNNRGGNDNRAANHRDNKNRGNNETHNDSIILAAVIEFIHTATLLHDDVVDASKMRRGRATANHVWGNEASVLVGDFLYSRAFEMMLETNNMEVMRILAATTNAIAEGEVLQLMNARAPDTTERAYFDTIHRKTAKLFESAARLGMVAAGRPPAECAALADFGLRFGAAFQLVDDILDYRADSADTGKNAGDDLAEGKLTLPLIIALQRGGEKQRRVLRRAVEDGAREALAEVLGIVESTGALAYTTQLAKREAAAAVDALSGIRASPYKDALARLAEFAVRRGH